MKHRHIMFALLMSTVLVGPALAATATVVLEEPEVRTIVTESGFGDPVLVVREEDLWRVRTTNGDNASEVTLFVNAKGEILGAGEVAKTRIATSETTTTTTTTTTTEVNPQDTVTHDEVASIVIDAGFHNVHDIDFLDRKGVWKAEADDVTGEDFALHIDPLTGLIVHIEDD
ncbi:MAG: hypothetical protein HKN58_06740 [Xanthomonadales bacterium]|nr:hypothetical protein [Xanthomonadales bacterium]